MLKKSSILLLALVVLGGLFYYRFGDTPTLLDSDNEAEFRVKEEFIALTKKDFEEYQNLKSLEARYEKADEIFGKIVTLFLADLGLRLAHKPVAATDLEKSCPAIPVPTTAVSAPASSSSPIPAPAEGAALKATPEVGRSLVTGESLEKSLEFSIGMFRQQKPMTKQVRDLFLGRFIGDIKFLSETRSSWLLEVETGDIRPGVVATIALTGNDNHKLIGRKRLNEIQYKNTFRSRGSYIFIEMPFTRKGFLQLVMTAENGGIWYGNYYEIRNGKSVPVGEIRLVRQ